MKNNFKISKRSKKQNFKNEAHELNNKFLRKLEKDIKRNNINCASCYDNSFTNFSSSCSQFNNRTKWNNN